ncbi:MAG: mechanosensitive ion channel [Saprospiraceae bacterium]|nr:mechanosensitive ion channel [Saprospiraceae bacterium]
MKPVIIKYIIRFLLLLILVFLKRFVIHNQALLGGAFPVVESIVEFLLFFTLVNIITAILIMFYRLRKNLPYKFTDNVITGINNVYYLIVTFGVIMMFLGFWKIDFNKLLTSISIVAAAIAIISKDYVASIISGIIITFSTDISIDDYVKIGDVKGKVLDINLTKVSILTDDDDVLFLPNEKVYTSEIINYTKREIKKVSIEFEMELNNFSTVSELESNLIASLVEFHHYIEHNSFYLKIVEINKDFIKFKFQYKLKESNVDVEKMIRRKTVRVLADSIKK